MYLNNCDSQKEKGESVWHFLLFRGISGKTGDRLKLFMLVIVCIEDAGNFNGCFRFIFFEINEAF